MVAAYWTSLDNTRLTCIISWSSQLLWKRGRENSRVIPFRRSHFPIASQTRHPESLHSGMCGPRGGMGTHVPSSGGTQKSTPRRVLWCLRAPRREQGTGVWRWGSGRSCLLLLVPHFLICQMEDATALTSSQGDDEGPRDLVNECGWSNAKATQKWVISVLGWEAIHIQVIWKSISLGGKWHQWGDEHPEIVWEPGRRLGLREEGVPCREDKKVATQRGEGNPGRQFGPSGEARLWRGSSPDLSHTGV